MRTYEEMKKTLFEAVERAKDKAIALNDWIADHPEISGQEVETSGHIVEFLRKEGFQVEYPYDGIETAFLATYGSNDHGRRAAVMAEYDALPGIGHACGHCTSGAASVLCALAMRELQEELDLDVHLIGTPAEEADGAKAHMVDHGVFDKYQMATMMHMFDDNVSHPVALALDQMLYTFKGKASHSAAEPWMGRNAYNGVQLFTHAIDMLRQHVKPDVRMHGIVRYPGEAPNVVPEKCSTEFHFRSQDRDYLNKMMEQVTKCAEGAALATGTTVEIVETAHSYDNIRYNRTGDEALRESYRELGLDVKESCSFGSTDAGNVSFACPAFHGLIEYAPPGTPIHTQEFAACVKTDKAYEALEQSAKIMGLHLIKIFSDEKRLEAMLKEFRDRG